MDGKIAELLPSNVFSVGFEIEFADGAVARQKISIPLVNGSFKKKSPVPGPLVLPTRWRPFELPDWD